MEHIALYRQFRPMNFDEIVEQDGPVSSLRQAVKLGRVGHAYLFSGQRGTGKTSIAKVFSRAVNCESPVNGNPCNECAICKGIISGSLMDVIEIDAASNNSVDNIRRICEEVSFAPSKAKYKVYIIDEVHMLSVSAFNALLKTLEEPPKHVIFLFATTEPHKIPATILSRCQRYDFKRITVESIASRLRYICEKEGFKADEDALTLIASLSDGAMRDAVSLLDQTGNASAEKIITRDSVLKITGTVDDQFLGNMAKALLEGDFEKLLELCEELSNSGRDITRFSLDLAQYFRDLMVIRMMPDPTKLIRTSSETMAFMYKLCEKTAAETLVAFISKLSSMISDLKWSPSVRTTFEIALIQLCGRKVKVEPVPLVIPDFVKKQQAFAKAYEKVASAEAAAPAPAPAPVAEEPKKPEKKLSILEEAAKIAPDSIPVIEKPKEEVKEEPKAETKEEAKEEPKAEPKHLFKPLKKEEEAPKEPSTLFSSTLESLKARTSILSEKKEEPKAEAAPAPAATPADEPVPPPSEDDIPAPDDTDVPPPILPGPEPDPEPTDPEDIPMENQIDLFSMPSREPAPAPAPAPAAAPAPAPTAAPAEEKPSTNDTPLLDLLSTSFLDDILPSSSSEPTITHYEEEEPQPEPEPEPQVAIAEPEKPKPSTSLVQMMEGEDLVKSKESSETELEPLKVTDGSDINAIWSSICKRVESKDYLLYVKLSKTELKLYGENAYVIVDSNYTKEKLEELTSDPLYKKIRSDIITVIPGTRKVYVATPKMFNNVLAKNTPAEPKFEQAGPKSALEDYLNRAEQLGIDIHFGDDLL